MQKYRKKPVVIEAVQFKLPLAVEGKLPEGVTVIIIDPHDGRILCEHKPNIAGPVGNLAFAIKTLEGWHTVTDGDWIITGIKGERYPCKPDIFAATYEPA
jgi:hypothetical protein